MRTYVVALVLGTAFGAAAADTPAPPKAAPPKAAPTDYAAEAQQMYRVAACGGDAAIPERFTAKVVDRHCKRLTGYYKQFKTSWVDKALPFINDIRPKDVPRTVVYPFGGGDLSSALAVYPDAAEITTISLEAAGDVRVVDTIKMDKLTSDLSAISDNIHYLYEAAFSTTEGLQKASHSELPGTIMFALAGLTLHEMEPVSLRYFDIQGDGTLRYLSNGELDERVAEYAATKRGEKKPAKITHYWYEQDSPFGNVEITFRPRGSDGKVPLRTYRHIVANLDDPHLTADDRVLKHLKLKGKVSVMTKAASFLLWYNDFTQIRNHLLATTAWMISDASGIPPSFAGPAGFEQITYGDFSGPYFIIDPTEKRFEFVKLWKNQPKRPLPFRFGYPDHDKRNHLMVTQPAPKK